MILPRFTMPIANGLAVAAALAAGCAGGRRDPWVFGDPALRYITDSAS